MPWGARPTVSARDLRHIAAITDRPVIRFLRHRPPLTAASVTRHLSRPSGRRAMAARRVPTRGREGAWDTWRFGDGSSVHGVDKTTCLIKRV